MGGGLKRKTIVNRIIKLINSKVFEVYGKNYVDVRYIIIMDFDQGNYWTSTSFSFILEICDSCLYRDTSGI
jgi:hypothetical protein